MSKKDTLSIEFTKDQYRKLLKLIWLGSWMKNSHREVEDTKSEDLVQWIYSFNKDFKSEDMVQYESELKGFFPTLKFEEKSFEAVEDYDGYTFWEYLADNLGRRDFESKFKPKKIDKMDPMEEFMAVNEFVDKYEREFSKNGIENLKLKKK